MLYLLTLLILLIPMWDIRPQCPLLEQSPGLQTTQPTSGGPVTTDSSCCANCVEHPRLHQWVPDLPFWDMSAMRTRWMAGAAAHKSDVETNPGPTT